MKKLLNRVFAVLMILTIALTSIYAEDSVGKVSVEKNDKGKVTSITFEIEGGATCQIKPSGKGSSLAKEADGEMALIKGKKSTKKDSEGNEVVWIKVKSYQLVLTGEVASKKDKNEKRIASITIGENEIKVDSKSKALAAKAEGKYVTAFVAKRKIKVGKEKKDIYILKSYQLAEANKEE